MAWSNAITAVFDTVKAVFNWRTGGRSHDENVTRDDAASSHDDTTRAIDAHDPVAASDALDHQRFVRDQARSKD